MKVIIPQIIDQYNTHLKNLIIAYNNQGVDVITGYEAFSFSSLAEVVHFHFPEGLLKSMRFDQSLFFSKMEFYKANGTIFLYTFHDAKPHSEILNIDYPVFFLKFLSYINLFIHHGKASIEITTKLYPSIINKQHIVCHHGDYLNEMKHFSSSQEEARKKINLPLNKKIILTFGQLQYKNTSFVLEVFKQLRYNSNQLYLLLAGINPIFRKSRFNKFFYLINNSLFNLPRRNKKIIHKRFSHYETYLTFIASDVIFLPHKSGLTSGLIPMAASLGKPFVYPDIGVFEEQSRFCLAEKYSVNDSISASSAIIKVLHNKLVHFDNSEWLINNNWDLHVRQILFNLQKLNKK